MLWCRYFAVRAGGVGGVWKVSNAVNPSRLERLEKNERMRRAGWELYDSKLPKELRAQLLPNSDKEVRSFVEMRIREMILNGDFENLKGKGKPFNYSDSAVRDGTFDLAMKMLKNNDLKPPWIELMQEIDKEKKAIRQFLRLQWLNYLVVSGNCLDQDVSPIDAGIWCKQEEEYLKQQIAQLNRKIDDFNLQKPERMDFIFRLRLRWIEEVKRAQQPLSQQESEWVKSKQMENLAKRSFNEKPKEVFQVSSGNERRASLSQFRRLVALFW
ncbi:hypothetical protein Gasu2_46070 [Galdieria sulphuraria]|uniref:Nucleobase:cation symporter-1, NCS1 family n=1 Tax=Galdieria sulphuraria TaxID=130081 RepID=M2Y7V9_GALSU|nr:nucleobase:cation symporter-1, NCS1 family [Galdieria sulphuraria]EME31909.1 nucleobase:cation symporter-1, NCS1 family [Galdieria sulphuraria]GJD10416.1 hypothetical protein Gasu2_46070 [Galdieria sulphuraria]|eukprot:XP_005708429.1 nucleobase:cation symporter-1, NCS1 family [Galdieria sulphuraria]